MGITDSDLIYGDYNLSHDVWVEDVVVPILSPRNVRIIQVEGMDSVYVLTANFSRIPSWCIAESERNHASAAVKRRESRQSLRYIASRCLQHRHETAETGRS